MTDSYLCIWTCCLGGSYRSPAM